MAQSVSQNCQEDAEIHPDSRPTTVRTSPRQALLELACLVFLIECIMWVVPFVPRPRTAYLALTLLIVLLLATCQARDRISPREMGFRLGNFLEVVKRILPTLAIFILLVTAFGLAAGTLRVGAKFYSMLASVPAWALLQQYMLLAFANRRLRIIFPQGSRAATSALFALLHLPNPVLTIACGVGGYVWAREYERSPSLLANALTHTVASAFLANSLPGWLLKNMVVGYNYFLR